MKYVIFTLMLVLSVISGLIAILALAGGEKVAFLIAATYWVVSTFMAIDIILDKK